MSQSASKSIVITGIVVIILGACLVVYFAVSGGDWLGGKAEDAGSAAAKAHLTAAAIAVDLYASQNGGYAGLSGQGLSAIDTQTQWVDGQPDVGQVGVINASDTSYTIAYRDEAGAVYQATKDKGKLVISGPGE